jgi:hypothetical protein
MRVAGSALTGALVMASTLVAIGGRPAAAAGSVAFRTPVRLPTFQQCGGYEPGIAVDQYENIYVTAHKQNHCDAAAVDPAAPDGVRAQSWMWVSQDSNGDRWTDMPGLLNLPAAPDQLDVGDEGDIALDDAGHFYFVDTKVVDDSFSRWKVTGSGTANITQETHRPVIPTLMPVDDRPWVTAHGAKTVMYAGNEGDKLTYDVGAATSGCGGPGRYTIFMSYDTGDTFDSIGCTLPDSGWCRPSADHVAGSQYLYMVCTNDSGADDQTTNEGSPGFTVGTLWSYVSADDGKTWKRYKIDNYNSDFSRATGDITWPATAVAKNGDVYALYNDTISVKGVKTASKLMLYKSTDHGQTWAAQNVTPANAGLIRYSWMDVARDSSTVGVGYFTHAKVTTNWHVFAGATPAFGQPVVYAPVDPVEVAPGGDFAFGDFFEVAFDPRGRLDVVYTRCTELNPGDPTTDCLNSDIYFAQTVSSVLGASAAASPSPGATVAPSAAPSPQPAAASSSPLPPTSPSVPFGLVAGWLGAALLAAWAIAGRRRVRRG